MCRHQQQFRLDEQSQATNLIFNNKTRPGSGSGLDVNEYRHSSKPGPINNSNSYFFPQKKTGCQLIFYSKKFR
jgi:hypothetical protein